MNEQCERLIGALRDARDAVIAAKEAGASASEIMRLRGQAHDCWLELEQFLRSEKTIPS